MQREYAIRQIAKRKRYHLEKRGDESYRLINGRSNVTVYQLDAAPLETIALFPGTAHHKDRPTKRLIFMHVHAPILTKGSV
jgi:hypothetical protein